MDGLTGVQLSVGEGDTSGGVAVSEEGGEGLESGGGGNQY